jgi:hypothetical protein
MLTAIPAHHDHVLPSTVPAAREPRIGEPLRTRSDEFQLLGGLIGEKL